MLGMLERIASGLGVRIIEAEPPQGKGCYTHQSGVILLAPWLSHREKVGTLGHELGHAIAGDEAVEDPRFAARQERAADQFAARLLINRREVEIAERAYGPNWPKIAHELGVTEHLLGVWLEMHTSRN